MTHIEYIIHLFPSGIGSSLYSLENWWKGKQIVFDEMGMGTEIETLALGTARAMDQALHFFSQFL